MSFSCNSHGFLDGLQNKIYPLIVTRALIKNRKEPVGRQAASLIISKGTIVTLDDYHSRSDFSHKLLPLITDGSYVFSCGNGTSGNNINDTSSRSSLQSSQPMTARFN